MSSKQPPTTPLAEDIPARSRERRGPDQEARDLSGSGTLLSQEELTRRREAVGQLLGAAVAQAEELHRFLAGAGFAHIPDHHGTPAPQEIDRGLN